MRKDRAQNLANFADLVEQFLKADKHTRKFEGVKWVELSQAEWCALLGISDRTLRTLATCSPIVMTKTKNDAGKPVVLYRTGSHEHDSVRHVANKMARLFSRKYPGRDIKPDEYGCLHGLAERWPSGHQAKIFTLVLDNWGEFRAAVKVAEPDSEHIERFYEFVIIRLIRKHSEVASEMYAQRLQAKGITPPQELWGIAPPPKLSGTL